MVSNLTNKQYHRHVGMKRVLVSGSSDDQMVKALIAEWQKCGALYANCSLFISVLRHYYPAPPEPQLFPVQCKLYQSVYAYDDAYLCTS